jgi:Outer membrane protein beta-barrel domain
MLSGISKVFLILILSISAHAQVFIGLGGGVGINNSLYNDFDNKSFDLKPGLGYHICFPVQLSLNSTLAVVSGFTFTAKDYSTQRVGKFSGQFTKFKNTYAQIPLAVQLNILSFKALHVNVKAGGFASYWMRGTLNGRTPNILNSSSSVDSNGNLIENIQWDSYTVPYNFQGFKDNRWECGVLMAIGITVPMKTYTLFLNENLFQSLMGQRKEYSIKGDRKVNQTWVLEVGFITRI